MVLVTDHTFNETLTAGISPLACPYHADVEEALLAALPPAWEVTRAIDPHGGVSTVVFPVDDAGTMPTFVLYEGDGFSEVATIRNDTWATDQEFADGAEAVAAIIAGVHATSYRA